MKSFRSIARQICFWLLLILLAAPLRAQVVTNPDIEAVAPSPQPLSGDVRQLQNALKRNVTDTAEAETLLAQARQLGYNPGLVVALCQLAALRFRDQQADEGTALLQEAEKIASRIQEMNELGWAMNQLRTIQRKFVRKYPDFATPSSAVMDVLATAMNASAATLRASIEAKIRNSRTPLPDAPSIPDKRQDDRPLPSADGSEYISGLSVRGYGLKPMRNLPTRPKFPDRWIDTLIHSATTSPQIVRQLTNRRKIRDSSQALSNAFAREGDYAKAYQYFLQYTAYKDSLTAEATTRRLASLEYKQNLLKKEAQIKLLTKDRQLSEQASGQQKQYVLLMIGVIVLLSAFLVILSRNNRAKHRANQRLNEQKDTLQKTLEELKTTQAQLIQAEKMASLGELTAGIAHEIQNPLNFVNNFSDVSTELMTELVEHRQQPSRDPDLEDELLTDVLQNLRKINQHGNRASAIVRGMLEHSRTSTGQKEPTDINALVNEYARLAYHGVRRSGDSATDNPLDAILSTTLDPNVGRVRVVPQDVGRVLLNLLTNAFYAVQQRQKQADSAYRPTVSVRTRRETNRVMITIRDNGTGIPEDVKTKVFQPFFTTKPTGQGTGLGLSLSYDIVTKGHGGKLDLVSEEGLFTELTVTLPADDVAL